MSHLLTRTFRAWIAGVLVFGGASLPGLIITSPASATGSLLPVADTYVNASSPTANYGRSIHINGGDSPLQIAYLKFTVTDADSAKYGTLRLWPGRDSRAEITVSRVDDTSWTEKTLKYGNRPAIGAPLDSTHFASSGLQESFDVSDAIHGNGTYTFAITTTGADRSLRFGSRESTQPPELGVSADPIPVATSFIITHSGPYYFRAVSPETGISSPVNSLGWVTVLAADQLTDSGGGVVQFPSGVFNDVRFRLDMFPVRNITFQGEGPANTEFRSYPHWNEWTDTWMDSEVFSFKNATNVTVRDLKATAVSPETPSPTSGAIKLDGTVDCLIENVEITADRGPGIVIDGQHVGRADSHGNAVRNVVVDRAATDGVVVLASNDNRVENTHIIRAASDGIVVTKSSAAARGQRNKKGNRNILSGNVIDAVGGNAINIVSSDDTQVLGNQITGSPAGSGPARSGIRIATTDGVTAERTLVRGNAGNPDQRPLYGLNMTSATVLETAVTGNKFYGSRAAIRDLGTRTVYQ